MNSPGLGFYGCHLQETQKWLPASDAARPDSQKGRVMADDGEVGGGNWKKSTRRKTRKTEKMEPGVQRWKWSHRVAVATLAAGSSL